MLASSVNNSANACLDRVEVRVRIRNPLRLDRLAERPMRERTRRRRQAYGRCSSCSS